MKFNIQRNQLLKPLQLVNGVVERRQTLPILGNVLLSANDDQLFLTGTDLEVELSGQANLASLSDAESVTVPARKLFDICRALPDETEISFHFEHHKLYLEAGNSRFSLMTMPALEFPKVKDAPDGIGFQLDATAFKTLIDRTQFAMAQQDVRYYLNGSLWEISGDTLSVVATDGHRLACCKIALGGEQVIDSAKVIVPRKAIIEIGKLLQDGADTINVVISANSIRVSCNEFVLTSKLIDGRYPDYQNVIPKGGKNQLVIDRDILKPVLARVAILSNEKFKGVRLSLEEGSLKVTANNPEHEEAEEQLSVEYTGDPIEVGVNVTYLIDVLNTSPKGNLVFTLTNAEKGVIVEHQNDDIEVLNVIMPMRL